MKAFALAMAGALVAVPAFAAETVYERRVQSEVTTQSPAPAPALTMRERIIILGPQVAADPFPFRGADNPSGVVGQDDLYEEGQSMATPTAPGSPFTTETRPGELNPQEVTPGFTR